MKLVMLPIPKEGTKCTNIECVNRVGEGAFTIVVVAEGRIVGGHRGLGLLLCDPCAGALKGASARS